MPINSPPQPGRSVTPSDSGEPPQHRRVFPRLLALTRWLVVIASVGTLLVATTLMVYGALATYRLIAQFVMAGTVQRSAKNLMLAGIEVADVFLLATVLYVIAIGLYELFIDNTLPVPAWLVITNIDDLKYKLISVVIAILGVTFLGQVIAWDGQRNLQPFGIAIGIVIAALTYFLSSRGEKQKRAPRSDE